MLDRADHTTDTTEWTPPIGVAFVLRRTREGLRTHFGTLLGSGGFGTVHEMRVSGGETIAAKVAEGAARERLRSEAAILAGLDLPTVPRFIDLAEEDDATILFMERIGGKNWRAILTNLPDRRLPWPGLLRACRQSAEAIGSLHDSGVIHGDVKPDNLLLAPGRDDPRPRTWTVDFGLARCLADPGARITLGGQTVGTPGYLDPATIGDALARGTPSDVFGLGATFYEWWRGRPLFGETQLPMLYGQSAAMRRHVELCLRHPSPDRRWNDLLARMLDPKPQLRPVIAEVRADLDRLFRPSRGRASSRGSVTRRGGTRRRGS